MEKESVNLIKKTESLKQIRLMLLRLHKDLVDFERKKIENQFGQISGGQFLQLLLNDVNFAWMRKFSTLIVEIDEMLALNDGFTNEMIETHLKVLEDLLNFKDSDAEFNTKYKGVLENNPAIEIKHFELKALLEK